MRPKQIGTRLREIRRERNLTQTEMARLARVSQSRISELESRGRLPAKAKLPGVAAAYGVEVGTLFPTARRR